jgi:hypothetical protein
LASSRDDLEIKLDFVYIKKKEPELPSALHKEAQALAILSQIDGMQSMIDREQALGHLLSRPQADKTS